MCLDTHKNGKPCIYMIKNTINNKAYIGSAVGHYRRKGQHLYLLRNNKHFNSHLQSSWNKYGETNFEFKVLEFVKNKEELSDREEFYITKFKSNNNERGFNFRTYCKTNLGVKRSLKSRLKQSVSKKGKTPNIDYKKIAILNSKAVKGVNKRTGETLAFKSIKEAGESLGIQRTSISKVLNKKLKSTGGFYWDLIGRPVLKNSVNSGELLQDNPEPSSLNGIKVDEKVQRLMGEEPTNKPNTSARPLYRVKI